MASMTVDERGPDHAFDVRTLRVSFAEQNHLVNHKRSCHPSPAAHRVSHPVNPTHTCNKLPSVYK